MRAVCIARVRNAYGDGLHHINFPARYSKFVQILLPVGLSPNIARFQRSNMRLWQNNLELLKCYNIGLSGSILMKISEKAQKTMFNVL